MGRGEGGGVGAAKYSSIYAVGLHVHNTCIKWKCIWADVVPPIRWGCGSIGEFAISSLASVGSYSTRNVSTRGGFIFLKYRLQCSGRSPTSIHNHSGKRQRLARMSQSSHFTHSKSKWSMNLNFPAIAKIVICSTRCQVLGTH